MLRASLGLPAGARRRRRARLAAPIGPNGPREHYMRAEVRAADDLPEIRPFDRQDSSLLSIFAHANGLLVRPIGDGPRKTGEIVEYLPLAPIAS
jgi:molybdopterin molybdotransferase